MGSFQRKNYNLGRYDKKEDAINARLEGEERFFGKYRKATVIRAAAGFVTIKFDTNNGNDGPSGIRVRESKVYHTEKEANDVVQVNKSRQKNSRKL